MLLYSTFYLARPLFVSEQLDSLHAVLTFQSPDWSKNLRVADRWSFHRTFRVLPDPHHQQLVTNNHSAYLTSSATSPASGLSGAPLRLHIIDTAARRLGMINRWVETLG